MSPRGEKAPAEEIRPSQDDSVSRDSPHPGEDGTAGSDAPKSPPASRSSASKTKTRSTPRKRAASRKKTGTGKAARRKSTRASSENTKTTPAAPDSANGSETDASRVVPQPGAPTPFGPGPDWEPDPDAPVFKDTLTLQLPFMADLTADGSAPRQEPGIDDPETARRELEDALPAWTAGEALAKKPFRKRADAKGDSAQDDSPRPLTPGELRLAEVELKEAIESLIDPKFRFNIAGREFTASEDGLEFFDEKVLVLLKDFFQLLVRRSNQRLDDFILRKKLRLLWARLRRRSHEAEAIANEVPFLPLEIALVNVKGQVLASASRNSRDAKLPILLKSAPPSFFSLAGGSAGFRRRPKRIKTRFSSKLALLVDANNTARKNYVVCRGSGFALAATVQGIAPRRFRQRLRLTLMAIQQGLAKDPAGSSGTVNAGRKEILTRYMQELVSLPNRHLVSPTRWIQAAGIAAVVLMLAAVVGSAFSLWHLYRWNGVVDAMKRTPGIEISQASAFSRPPAIIGLRDEFAVDPLTIVQQEGFFADELALNFSPYHSPHPVIAKRRARAALQAPEGITLRFEDDRIVATGAAHGNWLRASEKIKATLPPGLTLELSGVTNLDLESCRTSARQLIAQRIAFDSGDSLKPVILPDDLRKTADLILNLQQDAAVAEIPIAIRILGRYANPTEPFDARHLGIAQDRAEHARNLILAEESAIDPLALVPLGDRPVDTTDPDAARRNQSVEFIVRLEDEWITSGGPAANISAARVAK